MGFNLRKFLSDEWIEKKYIQAGRIFGDAVSYSYMGESGNMTSLLNAYDSWESEYARRGFRTINLDDFVALGGYGQELNKNLLRQRRDANEPAVLHAKIYRERFLGKIEPVVQIEKMFEDGQPQSAEYVLPSTQD